MEKWKIKGNANQRLVRGIQCKQRAQILTLVAEDTEEEKNRLNLAVGEMHSSIDEMLKAKEMVLGGEHREVLKT